MGKSRRWSVLDSPKRIVLLDKEVTSDGETGILQTCHVAVGTAFAAEAKE